MIVGGARRSLNAGQTCGDAYVWWRDDAFWTVCLVDGLGHGPDAALAAEAALSRAETYGDMAPGDIIAAVDLDIRWSRGAAMAVVRIDPFQRSLCYAGVGNVRGARFGPPTVRLEGTPGIVGAGIRTVRAETVAWADGDLLVLWTDGFDAYLKLDQACLRLKGDPDALALRLVERVSTGRDDAGVVCVLLQGPAA